MKRRPYRFALLFWGAGCVAATAAVSVYLLRRPPPGLLSRAHFVCRLSYPSYGWLSPTLALVVGGKPPWYILNTVNATNGREAPFGANGKQIPPGFPTPSLSVSPDGSWVLVSFDGGIVQVSGDGRKVTHRQIQVSSPPRDLWGFDRSHVWTHDGREWIGILRSTDRHYPFVVDASTGRTVLTPSYPNPVGTVIWPDPNESFLLGGTDSDRIVVSPDYYGRTAWQPHIALFYEFGLSGRDAGLRQWQVRFTQDEQPYAAALSPDGRRLAWLVRTVEHPSRLFELMCRLVPSLRRPARPVLELLVTRCDGTGRLSVGALPFSEDEASGMAMSRSLQWTPDGRRISFFCRGSLWTVPAP